MDQKILRKIQIVASVTITILCLALSASLIREMLMKPSYSDRFPLRTVILQVPIASRDAYFKKFNAFASQYGFTPRIARIDPRPGEYDTSMFRHDIEILGLNPFEPDVFKIAFYASPDLVVSNEIIEPLFESFKKTMIEVTGVTIKPSK